MPVLVKPTDAFDVKFRRPFLISDGFLRKTNETITSLSRKGQRRRTSPRLHALLAARQIRRRHLALRMLDPSSLPIHHAFLHHVMCLFRHITVFANLISALPFSLLLNAFFLRSTSYLFTFLFSPLGPQLHSLALFAPHEPW